MHPDTLRFSSQIFVPAYPNALFGIRIPHPSIRMPFYAFGYLSPKNSKLISSKFEIVLFSIKIV